MTVIVVLGDQDPAPMLEQYPEAQVARIPREPGDMSPATAEELETALAKHGGYSFWYDPGVDIRTEPDAVLPDVGKGWTYDEHSSALGLSGCTLDRLTTRPADQLPEPSVIVSGSGPDASIIAREVVKAIGDSSVVYED